MSRFDGRTSHLSRDPGGEPAPPADAGDWPLALAEHRLPVPPQEDPLVQAHHPVVASHELAAAPGPEMVNIAHWITLIVTVTM